jgi:hypothetical protein
MCIPKTCLHADGEKQYVRATSMSILLGDPSERVAAQVALLIANVARFDAPLPWESLLSDLAGAAAVESPVPLAGKVRALSTLKLVLRALRGKRFVIEAPGGVSSLSSAELEEMSRRVDDARSLLFQQVKALLGTLRSQWEGNFSALVSMGPEWEGRGRLASAGLAAMRELLFLPPDLTGVEAEFEATMRDGSRALAAMAAPLFAGRASAEGETDPHRRLLSKCWERLLQCGLVAMERFPSRFACFLGDWITLCINTALLGMDAAAVHSIRSKSRVLLIRFAARAMLQPLYHLNGSGAEEPFGLVAGGAATVHLQEAAAALTGLLSEAEGRCSALVQALVAKYIALSPEELAEWEADPEG